LEIEVANILEQARLSDTRAVYSPLELNAVAEPAIILSLGKIFIYKKISIFP
jgi:hypothetical protein